MVEKLAWRAHVLFAVIATSLHGHVVFETAEPASGGPGAPRFSGENAQIELSSKHKEVLLTHMLTPSHMYCHTRTNVKKFNNPLS